MIEVCITVTNISSVIKVLFTVSTYGFREVALSYVAELLFTAA